MKFKSCAVLAGLFLVMCQVSMGQQEDMTKLPNVIPPSPDASSLGKYGEMPVGKYTGIPQISIPIYTISQKDITLPVSLSYHAGGVKVEEHAGWTGLGWSLSAGGVITRSVVGLPDEKPGGYFNQPYDVNTIQSLPEQTIQNIVRAVNAKTTDLEPDRFTFNFTGVSGGFIVDKATLSGIASPKQNLKIQMSSSNNNIQGWTITDGNGFIYKFDKAERSIVESFDAANRTSAFVQNYNSSWYLTEILSPTGNKITINYQPYTNVYFSRQGSTRYLFLGGGYFDGTNLATCSNPPNDRETYSETTITGNRVESINFDNGYVKFVPGTTARLDMPGDYYLEAVEVYDNLNILLKRQKLTYSYYESNADLLSGSPALLYNTNFKKRLRLNKVEDITLPGQGAQYSFEYMPGELPSIFSNSQDHWGFYNGKSNPSLIPLDIVNGYGSAGVNRSVDINYSATGVLKKINYPTGGYTSFEFESNQAAVTESQYYAHFYPYGPTSAQYLQYYSAWVNYGKRTEDFYVDPKTVKVNGSSNFNYTVHLNNQSSCSGSDKDCIGNLEVLVTCLDCDGNTGGPGEVVSLTNGAFINGTSSGTILLIPGKNYRLEISGPNATINGASASISGNKEVLPVFGTTKMNIQVGGIRVKSVSDYTNLGASPVTTHYYYTSNLDAESVGTSAESSGSMVGFPVYEQLNTYVQRKQERPDLPGLIFNCHYKVMSSNSRAPLGGTGGASVGYAAVQTYRTDGIQKLKTLSLFSSPELYQDLINYEYPSVTELSRESLRGDLLEEKTYQYANNQYSLVKHITNVYERPSNQITYLPGLRIGITKFWPPELGNNEYVLRLYHLTADWKYLKSTTVKEFDQNGNSSLTKTINYSYDNPLHMQLTRSQETGSNGNKLTTAMLYAQDYSAGDPLIDELVSRHITSVPLEVVKYQEKNSVISVLSGNSIKYKAGGTGLKDEIKQLVNAGSIPLSSFKFSNKLTGYLPFDPGNNSLPAEDARYTRALKFDLYDSKGSILQVTGNDGVINSYIWGYNNTLPIVKAVGVDHATLLAAYNAVSGNLSLLRTHASLGNALVSTYTYKPLVGISSETDPRGRTTYYEYDNLNRLALVKDHEGNILKKLCYNYAGQPENCGFFSNQEQSGSFTRNNCGTDYEGGTVSYVVPAGRYFSAVSQQEANDMAQADVNASGQAYANSNGVCKPFMKYSNTSGIPYTITLTSVATGAVTSFSAYPSSTVQQLGAVTPGNYNITVAPMYSSSTTVQLSFNGTTQTAVSFTFSNVAVSTPATFVLSTAPASGPCSFTASPGFSIPTSSISNNGGTASFYIVFYSTSVMSQGNSYLVATVNGSCRPSTVRYISTTIGGRNWTITIHPDGKMYWQMAYGSSSISPYSSVGSSTLTYSL